ncbi:MAG: magnesium transporter [Planctomycetes bacterium]|nr:magnesium transporter [Planctomycetota bacterium]
MSEPTDQHEFDSPSDDEAGLQASSPSGAIEDIAETSPQDERVAELLEHTIDVPVLAEAVEQQEAADAADTLEALDEDEAAEVLEQMDEQAAAEALAEMQAPLAVHVIEDLIEENLPYAIKLLGVMAPDDATDLLQEIGDSYREQVLSEMSLATAAEYRKLIGYDAQTAGGLMTTDYLTLDDDQTVSGAIEKLRAQDLPQGVQHLLVVAEDDRVVGAVELRDLVLSQPSTPICDIMNRTVKAIRPDVDQEEVAREFARYDYSMLPVIDLDDRLIGIVTVDDVIDIIRAEQTEDVQKSVGAGAFEGVYSGIGEKLRGRLPWLGISLAMTCAAACVVFFFEDLIKQQPLLVFLMPAIAAVVGNAGQQALMVTLRGIVLDEVRKERILPLLWRETLVGMVSGIVLGSILCLCIGLLAGWLLGAVAGMTMALAMTMGTLVGAGVPLIMRRLGFDPAQSASIFLIMITDALAFSFLLILARTILVTASG